MKKGLFFILLLCFIILTACGNGSQSESSDQAMHEDTTGNIANFGTEMYSEEGKLQDIEPQENDTSIEKSNIDLDRKVIYTANLQIEVKSFEKTLPVIQEQVSKFGGYIVDSSMYEDPENEAKHGQVTARIPQEKFREFIKIVEEGSSKVLESSTSGQDVTEEYVDLESRLKSKRVVEDRLLTFMEQAEKTEDLLKISSDLAKVQEEIEEVTGRMKYLENKSDLATVSIYMQENNVTLAGIGKDKLNTWEKTKQQFMKSINYLITGFSSLFVFIIGNLPLLILLGIIVLIVFLFVRKKMNR